MRISIGTLSKAFDLSDEALRFYEKKNLLHPQRSGGGGYRVFERADIQRIANIKRFKNQGFSLDEIHSVYTCIDEASLQQLYSQKLEQTQYEITYRQHVLARMQDALSMIRNAPDTVNKPELITLGTVYALEYPSVEAMWERLPGDRTLKELFRQLPLTSFSTFVKQSSLNGGECDISKGILFFERDADVLRLDLSQFRRFDAQHAVSCLFRLKNGVFDVRALLDCLKTYMDANGFTACDDLFTVQYLSFVDENSDAIHYARMFVPILPPPDQKASHPND